MLNRLTIATFCALLAGLFAVSTASAVPARPATPPPTDFWQNKHFMNMAHQGGETEAPGNTLFAFKTAIADRGADTLEMDGYLAETGEFVITHDLSSNATSNLADTPLAGQNVSQLTLGELKTLDFAHKFRPGTGHYGFPHGEAPASDYPYRGMALEGGPTPPTGYTRNDFRIATFREVLDAFPNTPINVDMKAPGNNPALASEAAEEMANIMADYPERTNDVIVASFSSPAMTAFYDAMAEKGKTHNALTAGEGELLDYVSSQGENPIEPTPVALQPPDRRQLAPGVIVETVPLLRENATYDGFAIHVWPSGSPDSEVTWQKVMDQGADGFFTDKPGALHEYLCENGVPRPDGSLRCAQQQCPEGKEGYAPNCTDIPVGECPPNTTGTPPVCTPIVDKPPLPLTPNAKVKKLGFVKPKGKTKAGKKRKLTLKVTATKGKATWVKIRLKSASRRVKVRKFVKVKLKPGKTVKKVITLKSTRKAKGKVKITASSGAARTNTNPYYVGNTSEGGPPA